MPTHQVVTQERASSCKLTLNIHAKHMEALIIFYSWETSVAFSTGYTQLPSLRNTSLTRCVALLLMYTSDVACCDRHM
jgi:hypothetical protein